MERPVLNKRANSSFSSESKTASILAKSFLIRDDIRRNMLQQKQIEHIICKDYKKDLEKRSARRFCKSPFSINILADNEIQEHRRKLKFGNKKCQSLSRNLKKSKGTQKYLSKLREEIRKMNEGKGYVEEKLIEGKIMAQKTEDKLTRARRERKKLKKESRDGEGRVAELSELDDYDTFWADC
jgi:septal ring factor EnvC (AmiA/AmiB activator)